MNAFYGGYDDMNMIRSSVDDGCILIKGDCYLPYRAAYTLWLWTLEFTTYGYDRVFYWIITYAYHLTLQVHYLWLCALGFATHAYAYDYVMCICTFDKKITYSLDGPDSGSLIEYFYTHCFLCYTFQVKAGMDRWRTKIRDQGDHSLVPLMFLHVFHFPGLMVKSLKS